MCTYELQIYLDITKKANKLREPYVPFQKESQGVEGEFLRQQRFVVNKM